MSRLLVHGSGFARPFKTDPEELRCGKPAAVRGNPNCHWSPSTLDWEALGRTSGGSTAAATVDELIKVIASQGIETVDELRIIGHSNGQFLALGGGIKLDQVEFDEAAMIGSSKTFLTAAPKIRALQDRFKAEGRIVLAGCGSGGIGSNLLDLVSNTLLRTVAGFKEPILYAIEGTTRGPEVRDRNGQVIGRRIDDDARITVRGKAMYSIAANRIEDVLGADFVGTAVLGTDAWLLTPDVESKAGNIFDAVGRFKTSPGVVTAAEVGFKVLRAFHSTRAHIVSGMGFAGDLAGLRVKEDDITKGHMFIEVGKIYV